MADEVVAAALAVVAPRSDRGTRAGSGLTAREQDVLRLVAEGRTDREVADALFVSRRYGPFPVDGKRVRVETAVALVTVASPVATPAP